MRGCHDDIVDGGGYYHVLTNIIKPDKKYWTTVPARIIANIKWTNSMD